MTMMFAGLTSAFSKSRADWLKDFQLPTAFFYSTAAMAVVSHLFGKKAIQKKIIKQTTLFLVYTSS
jgi:cytochrome c oxidase subunit 3